MFKQSCNNSGSRLNRVFEDTFGRTPHILVRKCFDNVHEVCSLCADPSKITCVKGQRYFIADYGSLYRLVRLPLCIWARIIHFKACLNLRALCSFFIFWGVIASTLAKIRSIAQALGWSLALAGVPSDQSSSFPLITIWSTTLKTIQDRFKIVAYTYCVIVALHTKASGYGFEEVGKRYSSTTRLAHTNRMHRFGALPILPISCATSVCKRWVAYAISRVSPQLVMMLLQQVFPLNFLGLTSKPFDEVMRESIYCRFSKLRRRNDQYCRPESHSYMTLQTCKITSSWSWTRLFNPQVSRKRHDGRQNPCFEASRIRVKRHILKIKQCTYFTAGFFCSASQLQHVCKNLNNVIYQ